MEIQGNRKRVANDTTDAELNDHVTIQIALLAFRNECVPGRFTELLRWLDRLRGIAENIAQLGDENEQLRAIIAFNTAHIHFQAVVRQSYSMYLLEDEDGASTDAGRLARALASPANRETLLLATTWLCSVALCSSGLRRSRDSRILWEGVIEASIFPAAAKIAPPIDAEELINKWADEHKSYCRELEADGSKVIDLSFPPGFAAFHAGALILKLLQDGPDKALTDRARHLAVRALHFLQAPAIDSWMVQGYKEIRENDSLRAILDELLGYELEPVNGVQLIFRGKPRIYTLTKDSKRRYVILLPQADYFFSEPERALYDAFDTDPIQFIRNHLDEIPRSIRVQAIERKLAQIRDLQNEETITTFTKALITEVTASAIAYSLCASFNLPPEARDVIAVVVAPLIELARRKSG